MDDFVPNVELDPEEVDSHSNERDPALSFGLFECPKEAEEADPVLIPVPAFCLAFLGILIWDPHPFEGSTDEAARLE